jgi:hypothetical protein
MVQPNNEYFMSIDRTLESTGSFGSDLLPRGIDYVVKNPGSSALVALVGLVAWSAFSMVRAYKAFTKEFEEQERLAQERIKNLKPFVPQRPKMAQKRYTRPPKFKPKLESIQEEIEALAPNKHKPAPFLKNFKKSPPFISTLDTWEE